MKTEKRISWIYSWPMLFAGCLFPFFALAQTSAVDSLLRVLDRVENAEEQASVLNELAKKQAIQHPAEAIKYGEQALHLAHRHNLEAQEAAAYRWLAAASFYKNLPDSALNYGRRFAHLAERLGDQEGLLFAQKLMAYSSESLNRPDSASHYFRKYFQLAEGQGKQADAANALNSLGVIAFNLGQFQEALSFYEKAKTRYNDLRDTAMLALTNNNIGTLYRDMGQPEKAMEHLFAGLDIAEKSGNNYHTNLAFHNIGLVHWDQKNYDKALAYLRKAIAIDDPQLAFIKANDFSTLGAVFFEMEELDSAGHYYSVARQTAEKTNNQRLLASILNQQGALYLKRKQWESAQQELGLARAISEELDFPKEKVMAGYAFGRLYLETGKPQKAIQILVSALSLADSLGYVDAKLEALEDLAGAYTQTGNFATAFDVSQKYIALHDSLTQKEKTRQIAELETRYQTAQKEQQLAEQSLELERQARTKQQILLGSLLVILTLFGFFQFWKNKARLKRKEAELELSLKKAEAEKLKELDSLKSTFFANISHEFRTPLTLILGPVQQAMESVPASEPIEEVKDIPVKGRHLEVVRRNALRLQNLVDQLLDLSKLDNGKMRLQVSQGPLVQFIRNLVFSFESLAERKRIHLQTSFPPELEDAFFDRDKWEKILVNLLSNAFKFTPENGTIGVEVESCSAGLRVRISDSGKGMDAGEINKIFDRFYQVEGTEARGTGIGLSLVKELVELHRGQISVESAKGKGTTFKVSLPVARDAFDESAITTSSVSSHDGYLPVFVDAEHQVDGMAATSPPPLGEAGRGRLLIVEDNPDLRSFISETMQGGYQILTAENGKTGLEKAIEKTPDLIISDVMMPIMDGFEMCGFLKKDERTSHIPVILLTAKAGQQHKVAGLETGADAYLTKPFDEKELLVRARNLVEQRRKLRERFAGVGHLGSVRRLAPSEVAVTSTDQRFLEKVTAAIEENMDNEFFSVEDLASAVAFSRSQLHRKLKALVGKSPNELIREFRLARAKELLEKGHGNVSEVAMEVGYSSLSYFTRSFKAAFGVAPSEVSGGYLGRRQK